MQLIAVLKHVFTTSASLRQLHYHEVYARYSSISSSSPRICNTHTRYKWADISSHQHFGSTAEPSRQRIRFRLYHSSKVLGGKVVEYQRTRRACAEEFSVGGGGEVRGSSLGHVVGEGAKKSRSGELKGGVACKGPGTNVPLQMAFQNTMKSGYIATTVLRLRSRGGAVCFESEWNIG
eukprot:764836-Hanusia_phi.AAC.3